MHRIRVVWKVCLLLICCALPLIARAASTDSVVPSIVKFTGVLNDITGKPLTGTVGVTFLLYKEQSGGTPLWMETQNVQADKNGHYTVQLGTSKSAGLPTELFSSGEARWLGVQLSGAAEQPRTLLLSVPYALKAADAQTLGGLPPSAFLLATPLTTTVNAATAGTAAPQPPQAVGTTPVTTAGGTVQSLAKFDGTANITSSQIFDNGTNVGIGNSSPGAKLDVKGTSIFRGAVTLPATAAAVAAAGKNSQSLNFAASAFNIGTKKAVNETFLWQAEPVGNNTATPSGKLNLLFGSGNVAPSETGLSISNGGILQFAAGQTFPGSGTVTSVGLTAPLSDFTVTGSPVTSNGTLNLQWLVPPTNSDVPNGIVKRDFLGGFSAGDVAVTTISALNTNPFGAGPNAVLGVDGTNSIFGSGVRGDSSNGIGVIGVSDGNDLGRTEDGPRIGVSGTAVFETGQGVVGESFATQVDRFGVGPDGVDGISNSPLGSGVAAVNTTSGDGLFAQSNGGFAAFFLGDVDVDGVLSKAAGSFKIDHPLDPANKYLYHSFVESPDMMNIYNGNVTTDGAGKAIVNMPEWFEALNRDFRYQLTVIGQFAQAMVASEIANHSFTIQTDKPNVKVSWQVTGIRHDAFADAHRIPVEQLKTGKDRGLYLHPELFGASLEKSIAAARHPSVTKRLKNSKAKPTDLTKH